MNYFAPPSFLNFGCPRRNRERLTSFTIDPINDQYNSELYWVVSYVKDYKFYTSAYNFKDFRITSPAFQTEEEAIRWIEKKLINLVSKKLRERKKQLFAEFQHNNKYLENLKKARNKNA